MKNLRLFTGWLVALAMLFCPTTSLLAQTLSPTNVIFVPQLVGTTSPAQIVTLTNGPTVPLTITSITTTGDFSQTSNCPIAPNTLAAGAACQISVEFTAAVNGQWAGILTVNDSAPNSPQTANLSGLGVSPAAKGELLGLVSIAITPNNPSVAAGQQQQLVATGTFKNGQSLNVSNAVTWSSSAPSVAQVTPQGLVQALAPGVAVITASYGSFGGQTTVSVIPPVLTSITVTPADPSVPAGAYQQFIAILYYSNGSQTQETSGLTWSSGSAIASISSSGLAYGLSAGNTTITASQGSIQGSTTLTVFQLQCTTPPPGLVSWWTGDENTVDIAGNNSGMLQNAAYGSGEVGQAFSFNGSGSSMLVNAPVYAPNAGTLMFWFLPTGTGVMTGSYAGGENRAPGLSIDSLGNLNWEFGNLFAQVIEQVNPNQWQQVALTYSTSNSEVTVNVYLDGALVASAITDANTSWNPQVAFGAYLGAQEPSFSGSMDEITIFNQALSEQQIQQVYNAYSAGMCKPTLQSINVTPANSSLAPGLSLQFDAAGTYSDTTVHDVTTSALWSTSDPTVATINASALATAVADGNVTISAALGSVQGSTGLTVEPTLVSIQVSPQNPSSPAGLNQAFTATGTFTDGSQQDVTNSVSWSSSVTAVATIASNGLATCLTAGQTTITATAGSVLGFTTLTVNPATLSSITVNPTNPTIAAGMQQQFTATGTFSDGSQQDVTNSASWTSSLTAVATIAPSGLATAVVAGQTTITAASGAINGSTTLTVSPAVLVSITVNPSNPSIPVGNTQAFTANGTYSDGSQQDLTGSVTWGSSNPTVATIDSTGLATSWSIGTATIGATLNTISGYTTLTVTPVPPSLVSINVTPANPTVFIGQNQQFDAMGTFSDGSQQDITSSVLWSSTQPSVAGISTGGLASALSGGSTTINATAGSIIGSASLNVNPLALVSIGITPNGPSIALGTNQQFAATGTYADGSTLDLTSSASWSSTPTSVASINTTGLATSVSTGQATITATAASVNGYATLTVTAATLVSIAVTPTSPTIPLDTNLQFAATGTFSDGSIQDVTTSVEWGSSNGTVATISNAAGTQGLATGVASGVSTISAQSGTVSGSATLTVGNAALVSIAVSPASPSIASGTTQQFVATGTFTDGSQQDLTTSVSWSSANPAVASVSPAGLATSLSVGTSMITAALSDVNGSTLLTVTPATVVSIAVNPVTTAVPAGINQAFTAQATFTDGSIQDVTASAHWSSSVPTVATISNSPGTNGLATTLSSGNTIVTATLESVPGSANLTVTSAVLAAIQISPVSPTIPLAGTLQFTATGFYTDGSSANITTAVTWSSSAPAVAIVSNAAGSQGLANALGFGDTTISASSGSVLDSTALTVQDQLVSISVTPASAVVVPDADQQFEATGTYASGVQQNLTNQVLWTSSNTAVATITSAGLAMSVSAGQSTISAALDSLTSSAQLTVTPIQHVVVIFQENRTPDNLFHDPILIANGADIASSGLNSKGQTITLQPGPLATNYDLDHSHPAFVEMYDNGKMDGADKISVTCQGGPQNCPPNPQFWYVQASDVGPYFQLAETYAFADRMFQTNQGPSFPAHQFIISGTSAPTATSDLFASENPAGVSNALSDTGCTAPTGEYVNLINPLGNESSTQYPCFEHANVTDLLDAQSFTWRYYTPTLGSIWVGPNAIQHIRLGPDWSYVITPQTQILTDIANGNLASVSWVIPTGQASDHAGENNGTGPSWVASVVNAIGNSPYWSSTAILITWDDWGGWYDHVAPSVINSYEYGFRVPLIVVSPYAKPAYISHMTHDFGSILKFIEGTYNLPSLGYADAPADDLSDCFNYGQNPLSFIQINAPLGAEFFLNDKSPPTDPDDD